MSVWVSLFDDMPASRPVLVWEGVTAIGLFGTIALFLFDEAPT